MPLWRAVRAVRAQHRQQLLDGLGRRGLRSHPVGRDFSDAGRRRRLWPLRAGAVVTRPELIGTNHHWEETMSRITRRSILAAAPGVLALTVPMLSPRRASAKDYDPGVTVTEIKVGNTAPYSGPASSYGTIGKCETAFYKMINE